MTNHVVDASQNRAVRVAGFTFLFFTVVSILHYTAIELNLIVSENTAAIANFIETNELLFRWGIAVDLILFISLMIVSLALYIILKTINKNLALFALLLMLMETALVVVIELTSFMALLLLNDSEYLTVFDAAQLQALVGLFLEVRAAGYGIAMLFFSLGLAIFSYLFFRSNYISRALAVWGLFSFSLMLIAILSQIIIPDYTVTKIILSVSSISVMFFQIMIGVWLLYKGVKVPERTESERY